MKNTNRVKYLIIFIISIFITSSMLISCSKNDVPGSQDNSDIHPLPDDSHSKPDEGHKPQPNPSPDEEHKPQPTPGPDEEHKPLPNPDPDEEHKPLPNPDPDEEDKPQPNPGPDEEHKPLPNPEFDKKYDPFYPISFDDTPYILNVPDMNNRFILNDDKTIATLFAPGVSKDGGFYDVNKNFVNDNRLCWAAASSNMIAWYLDRAEELGISLINVERNVNNIFNLFKSNWNYEYGYDPLQGLAWYFTGKTLTGGKPDELLNENSGGYLKSLPNVGDVWSILDPVNHYPIVGNYQLKYPFIDDNLLYDDTTYNFSRNVVTQLHYGPSALMIISRGSSALGGHAITLWGCDFDTTTGIVKAIYITDSDDEAAHPGTYLRKIKIKPETGDHGVSMVDYWPLRGNPSPFLYITAGTNLFSPEVVSFK